jgi:APA family basic amino acid/polyamine antiporter
LASLLFRTKSIDQLLAEAELPARRLKRTLGWLSLTALGIGAIIGTGIFVLTGTAAAGEVVKYPSIFKAPLLEVLLHGGHALGVAGRPGAGPGIALSFLLVAIVCGLAGLCYAELASMIPIAGSAYTYTYATLGELIAWIIGWDLILEYAVSNMAVAVGFSAYIDSLLGGFGLHLPAAWSQPAYSPATGWALHFNVVGFIIVMLLTMLLVIGIRESAGANNMMVGVKVLAILIFILVAERFIRPVNWRPFMPNGWQGVLTGGAIVFFTYIGFDSVSTAAEECRNPRRDVPLGILCSLAVCAVLYVAVAVVLTGIEPWQRLRNAAPIANALHAIGLYETERWVTIGALTGMISSLLVYQLGQARVWFAMSRDGLLPPAFSRVHRRFRTPDVATWVAGFVVGIPAGIFDIGTLADLANIGTLFAFVLVSIAVIVLRRTQPDRPRGFHVPLMPWIPALSVFCCVILMASLTVENWIRFFLWLVIGMFLYLSYGIRRSSAAAATPPAPRQSLVLQADQWLLWLSGLVLAIGVVLAGVIAGGYLRPDVFHIGAAAATMIWGAAFGLVARRHYRADGRLEPAAASGAPRPTATEKQ